MLRHFLCLKFIFKIRRVIDNNQKQCCDNYWYPLRQVKKNCHKLLKCIQNHIVLVEEVRLCPKILHLMLRVKTYLSILCLTSKTNPEVRHGSNRHIRKIASSQVFHINFRLNVISCVNIYCRFISHRVLSIQRSTKHIIMQFKFDYFCKRNVYGQHE